MNPVVFIQFSVMNGSLVNLATTGCLMHCQMRNSDTHYLCKPLGDYQNTLDDKGINNWESEMWWVVRMTLVRCRQYKSCGIPLLLCMRSHPETDYTNWPSKPVVTEALGLRTDAQHWGWDTLVSSAMDFSPDGLTYSASNSPSLHFSLFHLSSASYTPFPIF